MPTPPTVGHVASEPPVIPSDERLQMIRAGHSGDAETARRGCRSHDPAVREAAYAALARLDQLDPQTLVDSLRDSSVRVIRRATELAASGAASTDVDRELLQILIGDDHTLAESAAWALGERHEASDGLATRPAADAETDPTVFEALAQAATRHRDALVREAATAALGSIGEPSTLWAVLAACTDKATVRRRAVIALAAFDGPEVDAMLELARQDRDWQVRQAAEDLL